MKNYLASIMFSQIIGGSIFFAVLFGAPYSNSLKVLAAILFFFVSLTLFTVVVTYIVFAQGLRILGERVSKLGASEPSSQSTIEIPQALMRLTGGIVVGKSTRLGYLFFGVFALSILMGWFFRNLFG